MECLHLFKAAKFGSLKMHVLCKVGKNIIFQNKTFLGMFYRQNKTFWYQFCNFKHFLKAENSEDSLASSWHSKPMVSSVDSAWVDWLLALGPTRGPFTNTCKGGRCKKYLSQKFFGPPLQTAKKFQGPPFLPWKLQVNPIEEHVHVNSIFNGNLW